MSPLDYARAHRADAEAALTAALRIPSISADPAHAPDVRRCAEGLRDHLAAVGFGTAEVRETAGHPVVYAEDRSAGPDAPTVLVYGHYDVQPPDPLDLWTSPPFEPVVRDGRLYARGAADDKGQVFMHVQAAEAYFGTGTPLPVNLKLLVEGEEEVGSGHLAPYVEAHADEFACDVIVISDTAMFGPGVPSVTVGLRGLAYVQVTLDGPDRDLHSGVYGGGVENPINALARLIAGLHDADHRVTLPGFYDAVVPLTDAERRAWAELPFDEAGWLSEVGLTAGKTEAGYSIFEGTTARPTLDVNGIGGGYQGAGSKTVLPARAFAKISCRLVPGQEPHAVAELLRAYFEAHTPPTMRLTFEELHGGMPVLMDTAGPAMQAAKTALAETYGREPYFTREGGSIPVVADLKRILGVDAVLLGFGLTTDSIHSPDEHFGLDRYHEGIETIVRFWDHYGRG